MTCNVLLLVLVVVGFSSCCCCSCSCGSSCGSSTSVSFSCCFRFFFFFLLCFRFSYSFCDAMAKIKFRNSWAISRISGFDFGYSLRSRSRTSRAYCRMPPMTSIRPVAYTCGEVWCCVLRLPPASIEGWTQHASILRWTQCARF
jgi:hypothetical protein